QGDSGGRDRLRRRAKRKAGRLDRADGRLHGAQRPGPHRTGLVTQVDSAPQEIEHMAEKPSWNLTGVVLISCNCDYGCPCNFNAPPSHGKCEGGWTWHVERGSFAGVPLDNLNFSVYANWPGAIHEGNGEALILVDARADGRQRDAIATLVRGEVGGPWGVLAWTWPTIHGPLAVEYEVALNGT